MSSVEGLDELLANLSGLGGDIKEASRKGLERGAKRIQANAKYLCPVRDTEKKKYKYVTKQSKLEKKNKQVNKKKKTGKGKRTVKSGGQLRNSIKTKSEVTIDGAKAQVFSNLNYATFVNFGTGQRGAKQDDNGNPIHHRADWKGQRPQPFMSSAYLHAKNNNTVEKDVTTYVQQVIRKLGSGK